MALTKTQVSMLYVAIFNRASEGEGNKYWQTNQPDMASTANAMLNTPDAKAYFGSSLDADQAFIELIYKNTLNKTYSDDKDGIDYWVKELANKSRGEVVAALVNAVADYKDSTDATTKAAYDQFMNRVEVSDYVADKMEKAPDDYKTSLGFDGDLTVTNDASTVTTAESIIDDAVQSANAQKLTVQPDNIHGTSGDDLFDGSVVQNTINGNNVDTFTSSDKIDGGTGNDTFIIQNMGNNVSGAVSNVENIKFTAFGAVTYDMSNTTGVTDFLNQNSVADLTVTGANEMNLGIKSVNNKNTEITFSDTVYKTTTDSINLTLENVTGGSDIELNGNTIETVNIESKTATNKVEMGGTAVKDTTKLVITGDKDLNLKDTDEDTDGTGGTDGATPMVKITTVDASAFTGDLDLDLSNGGAVNLDITGGTGDDKITMINFTKDDKIDLGVGKDRVDIALSNDVTTAASITNVETLTLDASANVTVKLEDVTSLEELNVKTGGETVTVTKAVASAKTINVLNSTITSDVTLDSVGFALKDSTGTADSLTVNVKTIDANENAANMDDTKQATMASLSANGIENITLTTAGLGKDDTSTTTVKEGGLVLTSLSTDAMQTLTITGDTYIKINNQLDDSLATIDASGAAGGVNLDISAIADADDDNTSTYSVTTGAGDDTLNNISDAARGTIKTGDGKDSLTLTSATTTTGFTSNFDSKVAIDMGAGDDKVSVTTATAFTSGSTLDMGEGTDTLTITTTANDIDLTDLTLSNVNKIVLDGSGTHTYTLNLASLEDQTIEITNVASITTTGIVAGTSTNDTIDLSLSDAHSFKGIDFIGDNNLVGVNGNAGDDTIIGNDLANNITGGAGDDTIDGGAGDDTIDGGAGNDTIIFADTAAHNGIDVFDTKFIVADDTMNFKNFLSDGTFNATTIEHDSTGDTDITNKVSLLAAADGGVAEVDTAAEVAALIEGDGDAMSLTSGGKAILIAGDDSAATAGANIWYVDDSLGANNGTIEADDIFSVGTMTIDIDTITTTNIVFS